MLLSSGTPMSFGSNTMNHTTRSFIAVLISGLIVWTILTNSMFYLLHWWGFLFMLGATYLVVETGLQIMLERASKSH
jgi:hypothetical protein